MYTAVTVYTIFAASGKNIAYWWVQTCSTGLHQSERTTLAVLLLPLVVGVVSHTAPLLVCALVGCPGFASASAVVLLPAHRVPCPPSLLMVPLA